jgi:hypothetical protein
MAVASPRDLAATGAADAETTGQTQSKSIAFKAMMKKASPARASIDTTPSLESSMPVGSSLEFDGDINTNNDLPTMETLKAVENFPILDQDGKAVPFKTLYTGPNVARRVLVIFIRHFFCGVSVPSLRIPTSAL